MIRIPPRSKRNEQPVPHTRVVRAARRCVTREKAAFSKGSEAAREIQMLIVRQELIAKQQDSALAHEPPQRTDDGFRDCVTAGQVQTADFGSGLPRKRA